ncbi:MAG TPA: 2-phosphosulfolactate phosphatase [Tepidisphaeraceae bacterium]|nr:2-phosphosulfolactate phosphatase [Tepidisphaeraceae bacterium]
MEVDVVLLPRDLEPRHLRGRAVVVFDVLRATTTVAAALAAGVKEIRIFGSIAEARVAAGRHGGGASTRILCGEEDCLPPAGFDLGNSPASFSAVHAGRVAYMSTTNGTRAILAAREADVILTGALVNAEAVARALGEIGRNVTLLCAGTGGAVAMEDMLGAGAVLDALTRVGPTVSPGSDVSLIVQRLFNATRDDLYAALAQSLGGRNVIKAGLLADIDFSARCNVMDVVGDVQKDPLAVKRRGAN